MFHTEVGGCPGIYRIVQCSILRLEGAQGQNCAVFHTEVGEVGGCPGIKF